MKAIRTNDGSLIISEGKTNPRRTLLFNCRRKFVRVVPNKLFTDAVSINGANNLFEPRGIKILKPDKYHFVGDIKCSDTTLKVIVYFKKKKNSDTYFPWFVIADEGMVINKVKIESSDEKSLSDTITDIEEFTKEITKENALSTIKMFKSKFGKRK